jgi:hypothetical protein
MNNIERKIIIRDAITKSQKKNIKLSNQTWGIFWDKKNYRWSIDKKNACCCALSCVVLEYQNKLNRKVSHKEYMIETILEVELSWIRSFIRGFDGFEKCEMDADAYDLGLSLRDGLVNDIQKELF